MKPIGGWLIAWTPNREEFPAGFRGKVRLFPAGTAPAELSLFPCLAGSIDPRAHSPSRETREAYAITLALAMVGRHGLDHSAVHQVMLEIDEYATGTCELVEETT